MFQDLLEDDSDDFMSSHYAKLQKVLSLSNDFRLSHQPDTVSRKVQVRAVDFIAAQEF